MNPSQVYVQLPFQSGDTQVAQKVASVINQLSKEMDKKVRVASSVVLPGVIQPSLLLICDLEEPPFFGTRQ